jgi:hypothetical protein
MSSIGRGTSALLPKTRRENRWCRPQDREGTCAKWIATFAEVIPAVASAKVDFVLVNPAIKNKGDTI